MWLRQRDPDDSGHPVAYWFCEALHGSTLPRDFGLWCLDQALEIGDTEPQVSEGLLLEAYRSLHGPTASGDPDAGSHARATSGRTDTGSAA